MRNGLLILSLAIVGSMASAKDLVVHEWGTFTSVMGADGKPQPGMHREEEPLPNFVYGVGNTQESGASLFSTNSSEDPCRRPSKVPCEWLAPVAPAPEGISVLGESIPSNPVRIGVTQKMETPVIYFYGDEGQKVSATVDFPNGIISQYYPRATSYTPKFSEVNGLGPSQFRFDVELLSSSANTKIPRTRVGSIWNPAREVSANTIRVENEEEKFIFYRGVADFDPNFKVTSDTNDVLGFHNQSSQEVSALFILNSDGVMGNISKIGEFGSASKAPVPKIEEGLPFAEYVGTAKDQIVLALVETGLYVDEAKAMVNTWEKSYFLTPGIRVLYIVPRVETDRILPLSLKPVPKEVVRTLIGRVEVMTENQERQYLEVLGSNSDFDTEEIFGRFWEPKLRRLRERVQSSDVDELLKNRLLANIQRHLGKR